MREFGVVDILLLTLDKCCHVVKRNMERANAEGAKFLCKDH